MTHNAHQHIRLTTFFGGNSSIQYKSVQEVQLDVASMA